MREAEGLLSSVYRASKSDPYETWKDKKSAAQSEIARIFREEGGKAARDRVRDIAKAELMDVGRPKGYQGDITVDGLNEYRDQKYQEKLKLLADTDTEPGEEPSNAEDRDRLRQINSTIISIDNKIDRINDLKGIMQ